MSRQFNEKFRKFLALFEEMLDMIDSMPQPVRDYFVQVVTRLPEARFIDRKNADYVS